MSVTTLETVYERLAEAIDATGPEKETLLLAKLALLLAEALGDPDRVVGLIEDAARDLD